MSAVCSRVPTVAGMLCPSRSTVTCPLATLIWPISAAAAAAESPSAMSSIAPREVQVRGIDMFLPGRTSRAVYTALVTIRTRDELGVDEAAKIVVGALACGLAQR